MTSSRSTAPPALVVRRLIRASADRLFDAWTDPTQLQRWFGPRTATCTAADVDLRVGGSYRLVNQFDDGRIVTIAGEYRIIDRPRLLVYSWRVDGLPSASSPELVTVRFEPRGESTDVVVTHEHMATDDVSRGHASGWEQCLDRLAQYV